METVRNRLGSSTIVQFQGKFKQDTSSCDHTFYLQTAGIDKQMELSNFDWTFRTWFRLHTAPPLRWWRGHMCLKRSCWCIYGYEIKNVKLFQVFIFLYVGFNLLNQSTSLSLKVGQNFLANHWRLLISFYISFLFFFLFFNFMPKQSTLVGEYIAPFGLCKIYRSNITNNSYLMSLGPPLSTLCVFFTNYQTQTLQGQKTLFLTTQ